MEGVILKALSGFYYVDGGDGRLIACRGRGKFRHQKLTPLVGDRVTFTDVDGNVFLYSVAEIQILQPGDVEEMLSGGWALTLFTCTLGGRTRVTVRCEEVADAGRGYGLSI